MTRRARTTALATPTAPAAAPDTRTKREKALDAMPADARALLMRYGTRASTVKVWRWSTDYDQYEYVKQIAASDFTEDRIQARWGGGKYRGDVLDGANKYVGAIPAFVIAGEPIPIAAPGRTAAVHAAAPEPAGLTRLETIIGGLADTVRGLVETVRAQASSGGSQSRMAELKEMAETLKAIAPAASVIPAQTSPIQAVRDLMDAADVLGLSRGDGGGGTDWGAVVKEGVHPLVAVLRDQIALNRETMLRRRPVAVMAAPAAPHAQPAGPLAALVAELPAFARSYLANCAASDKDPALYAETVLDALPSDVIEGDPARGLPPLAELLAADDAATQLLLAVPEWAEHGDWMAQLVTAIRMSLAEDAADPGRT